MKKRLSMLLVLLTAVFALAGCGSAGDSTGSSEVYVSVDSLKTISDVLNLEKDQWERVVYDGQAIVAFEYGGNYYRVKADISPEDEQAYNDIDYSDDSAEEQVKTILGPLAITEVENLNDQILSREEMDALIGKTGQELQDEGWTYTGHDLGVMEFRMVYGPFAYKVVFDGKVPESEYDTFEDESGTKDMTVKLVWFDSMEDGIIIE